MKAETDRAFRSKTSQHANDQHLVPSAVRIAIQGDHILLPQASALAGDASSLLQFKSFAAALGKLWRTPKGAQVVFFTPYVLLPLLAIAAPFHRYFYLLHEPRLGRQRVGWRMFFKYEAWLLTSSIFVRFITASDHGLRLAERRAIISARTVAPPVPLCLFGTPTPRKSPPGKFDLGMWGSLNREKGLDRLIALAKLAPELKIGILGPDNKRMRNIEKYCQVEGLDISFDLHMGGFEEHQLEEFISGLGILILPQYDATQSGQIPYALRAAVPVVASDLPAFQSYAKNDTPAVRFIPSHQDIDAYAKLMRREIKTILDAYEEHSNSAANEFNSQHSNWFARRQLFTALTSV